METDNYEKISEHLTATGWHRSKGFMQYEKEYWYKRFNDAPRCLCNDDKEGIQAIIKVYYSIASDEYGFQIELVGQKPDGAWIKLEVYAWDGGLLEVMDEQIRQLILAWTLLASKK